jgi:hypothetical protein
MRLKLSVSVYRIQMDEARVYVVRRFFIMVMNLLIPEKAGHFFKA